MQRCEEVGRVDCGTYCQEDLWNKADGTEGGEGQGGKGEFAPLELEAKTGSIKNFNVFYPPPPLDLDIFRCHCGTQVYHSYDAYFEARFDFLSCVKVPKLNHI